MLLFGEDSVEGSLKIDPGGFALLLLLLFENEFSSWIGLNEGSESLDVRYPDALEHAEDEEGEELEEKAG